MTLPPMQTVAQAIRAATEQLGPRTDSARLDAELLMAHALGVSRSVMFLQRMGDAAPAAFAALVARRVASEPVAYILGQADFWGLTLEVSPAVLVPRADSETLIEAALTVMGPRTPVRIIDLGTGSGCLLLAALSEWPQAEGIGIDRSLESLACATRNARRLNLQAEMIRADWNAPGWAEGLGRFDLILANPPYVEEAADLAPDVRDHEPHGALFAGADGLDDYRVLVPQLPALLAPGGAALVEIGASQAEVVCAIGAAVGLESRVERDLAGRNRVIVFTISLGKDGCSA